MGWPYKHVARWKKGDRFLTWTDLDDNTGMVWDDRIKKAFPVPFIINWQYHVLRSLMRRGMLWTAVLNEPKMVRGLISVKGEPS